MPTVSYDTPGETSPEKEHIILSARNVMVQGWEVRFYDLFLKHLDEIRSLFAFLPEVEKAAATTIVTREGRLKLGLHVRRGDYARWNGGRYYFSDRQYAAMAARFAAQNSGKELTVLVCTNDPDIDRDTYREAVPEAEFVFAAGNPGEDLCLLSRCDAIIGAPSTFSLVASMYRDLPLYWIEDADKDFTSDDFSPFQHPLPANQITNHKQAKGNSQKEPMTVTLITLAAAAFFFVWGRIRADVVALCALLTLTLSGVITTGEALSGFANPIVIMMVGLLPVVGGAIFNTGLAKMTGARLMKLGGKQ